MEYFNKETARSLLSYSELYFLLGVIELTLRERIPATLSSNTSGKSWIEVISLDPYRGDELSQILARNPENIPNSVPFGFWCRLFTAKNFTTVWSRNLEPIFPEFSRKMSFSEFINICNMFKKLSKLRNRVAHYQIVSTQRQAQDMALLRKVLAELQISASVS